MAANAKTPTKPESRSTGFKEGDTIVCTSKASCGYTVGNEYTVYKNEDGYKCIMADDGFEDLLSMTVSTFRKVN